MLKKSKIFLFIFICFQSSFLFAFIKDTGTKDDIVDYEKYGYFENLDTPDYKYILQDRKGLGDIQGEGIFPNGWAIFSNPGFIQAKAKGLLEGNRWDFNHIDNPALMYYKWVDSFQENPGLRQFFIAEALQKGGYIKQALKAYYSILVFFPRETSKTYWKTPWYIGSVALDRINFLLNTHKEIHWKLIGANLNIKNKFDNNVFNDIFYINPGKFIIDKNCEIEKTKRKFVKEKIERFGNISLVKNENGQWQLKINNKAYLIKGLGYSPVVKGEKIYNKDFEDWSVRDENKNNKIDAPLESIVDGKVVGDFQLMKDMGVNTVRLYYDVKNKKILNTLFKDFDIRVMMDISLDFLRNVSLDEKYVLSEKDLKSIKNVVKKHKDESYLLMWVLGNEDNYYVNSSQVKNYYRILDQIAKVVKSIDRNHPIIIANGDLLYLDIFVDECKNIDIFGANVYRGEYGIGYSFWNDLKKYWGRPVIVTEYGCSAFNKSKDSEEKQLNYHKNSWEDIKYNSYENLEGSGLVLGGVAFEWLDEWWKAGKPTYQDQIAQWAGALPDGWMYEEFLGICGQGEITDDKLTRKLKKVYYFYKKNWN